MNNETQVQIQNKFCLTIDEAVIYFNIGEKKLRKLVSDNLDSGFIIQNGVKFLIKRKRFEDFLNDLTAIYKYRIISSHIVGYIVFPL